MFKSTRISIESPLQIDQVLQCLAVATRAGRNSTTGKNFSQRVFWGEINGTEFKLGKFEQINLGWSPVFVGHIIAHPSGSIITGSYRFRRSHVRDLFLILFLLLAIIPMTLANGLIIPRLAALVGIVAILFVSLFFGWKIRLTHESVILQLLKSCAGVPISG